jgi:hypothetical protein
VARGAATSVAVPRYPSEAILAKNRGIEPITADGERKPVRESVSTSTGADAGRTDAIADDEAEANEEKGDDSEPMVVTPGSCDCCKLSGTN